MRVLEIKDKLLNHLTQNGEKKTSEKILFKSLKKLQKDSNKSTKGLIKRAFMHSSPLVKIRVLKDKKKRKKNRVVKKLPYSLKTRISKISLAIKFIMETIKKKAKPIYGELTNEILLNSQNIGESVELKTNLHKQAFTIAKKYKHYKWR